MLNYFLFKRSRFDGQPAILRNESCSDRDIEARANLNYRNSRVSIVQCKPLRNTLSRLAEKTRPAQPNRDIDRRAIKGREKQSAKKPTHGAKEKLPDIYPAGMKVRTEMNNGDIEST